MKRGYMDWNKQLLPREMVEERQKKFVQGFEEKNIDAAVVYGDVAQADEMQYLTNLGPYWANDAAIFFKDGNVLMVTGHSARVNPWVSMITGMEMSKIIAAGPRINAKVAAVLKEHLSEGAAIGLTGKYFPQPMATAIKEAGFETVVYQDTINEQLKERDTSYVATIKQGVKLMNEAIGKVLQNPATKTMTRKRLAADVEYACRTAGAMDMMILNGDEKLVFGQPQEITDNENPWTLYAQIQYLGEWIVVARNMKEGYSKGALAARDKAAASLKPGAKKLVWKEDGYSFKISTKVLSDHITSIEAVDRVLKDNQIVSLAVTHESKGIYVEDMYLVTAKGGELLTNF